MLFLPPPSRWLALSLLPGLVACSQPADKEAAAATLPAAAAPVAVQVQTVSSASGGAEQTYSCTLEAENTANLGFGVAGTVERVLVREGDQVQAGQLLAELGRQEYASVLAGAEATLQEARDNARRSQQLFKSESLTERELVQATAELQRAEANSAVARKHVRDTHLRAPFAGLIAAKMVEPGVAALPGSPAFSLIKTQQVYARAVVPEAEVSRIRRGARVQVQVPALNQTLRGTVQVINPVADPASRSFNVKVLLPNPGLRLLPGMLASLHMALPGGGQPVVAEAPQLVVQEADGASIVYVPDAAGQTARRRRVVLGAVQGQQVIVTQGLAAGDKVIVAGQQRLRDGQPIRVL